jgi:hypothetical protein
MATKGGECVQVVVRCRPLFGNEVKENCKEIVDVTPKTNQINIKNPANEKDVSRIRKYSINNLICISIYLAIYVSVLYHTF